MRMFDLCLGKHKMWDVISFSYAVCVEHLSDTSCLKNMYSPSAFATWRVDVSDKNGFQTKY